MTQVLVYSTASCPYCTLAKNLLTKENIPFEEIRVDLDGEKREEMQRLSGRRTVPQIFINDKSIGGYDDLAALYKAGKLSDLLA